MAERRIPLFVINGFLDSGKSSFIKEALLRDPRIARERVLIICCEEGEVEFDDLPDFVRVHVIDDKEDYNEETLLDIHDEYKPTYIIIEYNGVWGMKHLYETPMPLQWNMIAQFTVVDASTFEMYFGNMKSIFADMMRLSARVYMNRCDRSQNFVFFRDSIKGCSPRTEIFYMSDEEGPLEITFEEDLPYDLEANPIPINKDNYMIWFIDTIENPDRYEGKVVEFNAQVVEEPMIREGYFLAGNTVMTCCEDDMEFMGFICKYDGANFPKPDANIKLRAEIHTEFAPEYGKPGPVLYVSKVTSMVTRNKNKKKKK